MLAHHGHKSNFFYSFNICVLLQTGANFPLKHPMHTHCPRPESVRTVPHPKPPLGKKFYGARSKRVSFLSSHPPQRKEPVCPGHALDDGVPTEERPDRVRREEDPAVNGAAAAKDGHATAGIGGVLGGGVDWQEGEESRESEEKGDEGGEGGDNGNG
jgi:hypothetical protein